MEQVSLGSGAGALRVSRVCLGTMTWGTQNTEAEAHAQLDLAFEGGINFIDTAEMYSVPPNADSYGKTETIIGRWLRRRPRESVVLATKVIGAGRSFNYIRSGHHDFTEKSLREALDGSLKRLQTDYVDLYQLHWPTRYVPMFGQLGFDVHQDRPGTPIAETLVALGKLVAEGKIRAIGLSNETPWGVMQFCRLADEMGLPRVVTVQNAYSLLNRTFELGLAEVCHREGVALLPYSVLGFGHLTGKYLDRPDAPGRLTQFPAFGARYAKPGVLPAVKAYVALARQHGLSPAVMAQAFVASRPFVGSTIVGATNLDQLAENIGACAVRLPSELIAAIEHIHEQWPNPAP